MRNLKNYKRLHFEPFSLACDVIQRIILGIFDILNIPETFHFDVFAGLLGNLWRHTFNTYLWVCISGLESAISHFYHSKITIHLF